MIACIKPQLRRVKFFPVISDLIEPTIDLEGNAMARSHFQFKKRQKELVKKKKKEDKRQWKLENKAVETDETEKDPAPGFHEGQKVALLISDRTEMGFIAVINGTQKGILYKNEVFQPLKIGQEIDGFIKKVRDDKKIDLCLQKLGYKAIDVMSRKIMEKIQQQDGFIAVTDKSRPQAIADLFGVSKKAFKKAIGNLYKKRLITLEKDSIRLQTAGSSN